MRSDLKKKLKKANKAWKTARTRAVEEPGFAEFDDGRYAMKLVDATIGESQSSGRLQIAWSWRFLEGDYEGKKKMDFDGLESEDNLMWTNRKIIKLGFEPPDDFDGIEKLLKEMVESGVTAMTRLKSKGEFQNLYIDKLIEESEDDDDEDEDDEDLTDEETDDEDEDSDEEDDEDEDEDEDEDDDDEEEETVAPPKKKKKGKKGKGK